MRFLSNQLLENLVKGRSPHTIFVNKFDRKKTDKLFGAKTKNFPAHHKLFWLLSLEKKLSHTLTFVLVYTYVKIWYTISNVEYQSGSILSCCCCCFAFAKCVAFSLLPISFNPMPFVIKMLLIYIHLHISFRHKNLFFFLLVLVIARRCQITHI